MIVITRIPWSPQESRGRGCSKQGFWLPRVSAKFEFRYGSLKRKVSLILLSSTIWSLDSLKRASKEGGIRVKFNPGLTPIGLRTINWAKSLGRPGFLGILYTGVWWPRTAIRNFLDNSRKFNFCNRLILKLLHFFSIKKILKMYFLFFKDNLFLKRLNSFDFWKYYKLFLKR